jgi:hypothetical protein
MGRQAKSLEPPGIFSVISNFNAITIYQKVGVYVK